VCLDSSAIKADGYLGRSTVLRLLAYQRVDDVQVVVPMVVRREVEELIRDEALRIRSELDGAIKSLLRLSAAVELDLPSESAVVVPPTSAFADRLREIGALELPVPDIDHGKVLDRIESRRRPFSDKGQGRDRGYKDFLIWESLKTYLASQDDVRRLILITGNIKDFADPDNPKLLHQHLREELDSLIDIQVSSSVRDFIKEHVEPYLTEIDLQSIVVSRDANLDKLTWFLYEHAEMNLPGTLPNDELGRPPDAYASMIVAVHGLNIVETEECYAIDESTAVMEVEVELDVDVRLTVDLRGLSPKERAEAMEYDRWFWKERVGAWGRYEVEFRLDGAELIPVDARLNYLSITHP